MLKHAGAPPHKCDELSAPASAHSHYMEFGNRRERFNLVWPMMASAGCEAEGTEIKGGFVKNEAESCFLRGGGVMLMIWNTLSLFLSFLKVWNKEGKNKQSLLQLCFRSPLITVETDSVTWRWRCPKQNAGLFFYLYFNGLHLLCPQMWMNARRRTGGVRLSAVTPLEASTAGVLLDSTWAKMGKPARVSLPLLLRSSRQSLSFLWDTAKECLQLFQTSCIDFRC